MNVFFEKVIASIKKFFGRGSTFQNIIEQAIKNILNQAIPAAIDLLSAVALAKVGEVDGSGMSNAEKRQAVLNELQKVAVKEGIKASTSVLNLILETAVNANKSK